MQIHLATAVVVACTAVVLAMLVESFWCVAADIADAYPLAQMLLFNVVCSLACSA